MISPENDIGGIMTANAYIYSNRENITAVIFWKNHILMS